MDYLYRTKDKLITRMYEFIEEAGLGFVALFDGLGL